MCGIAGIIDQKGSASSEDLDNMMGSLRHRGPDSNGKWISADCKIQFAHTRLAIHELSELGHQPMVSDCGNFIVVFNGEIYNFKSLKDALIKEGCSFRGNSDTEVLLNACIRWGVESAVKRFIGMFAFAILDKSANEMKLVRDRLGEKPLYFYDGSGCFLFASELTSLKQNSQFAGNIALSSVYHFLQYGYTPLLDTMYENVHKVAPGSIVTLNLDSMKLKSDEYWSIENIYKDSTGQKFTRSIDDLVDELDSKLTNSVRRQIVSDVPLGAFLSGGIDSSIVCAVASRLSSQKLKTFSVGFSEEKFDESGYARKVAEHLDTEHHEIIVTENQCLELLPKLHELYDEPFFDPSAVPTLLLSEFTRKKVTVALSGDGGDELFWGYNRYRTLGQRFNKVRSLSALNGPARILSKNHMPFLRSMPYGNAIARISSTVGASSYLEFYQKSRQIFNTGDLYKLFSNYSDSAMGTGIYEKNEISDLPFADLNDYLPNDILVKVDRAAMANSLETRIPLLDHELVEFSAFVPDKYKLANKEGKFILKQLLFRYVPSEFFDRPKKGFSIPLAAWLRGGLADYCKDIIRLAKSKDVLGLNFDYLEFLMNQHLTNKADHSSRLWAIVILLQYFLKEKAV